MIRQWAAHLARAWQLVRRNTLYQRRAWAAVVTALVEPAVYFAAVVLGLSRILGNDATQYVTFAGPALVAAVTMNGAVVECTNNVFFRWRQGRLYDSVLCTAMSGVEIALGDLIFGSLRGWLYGTALLALLALVSPPSAAALFASFLALPLVAVMFAGIGLLIVGFVQGWRQLQLVQLFFFVMFLSANTFVDLGDGHPVLAVITALMPLSYANQLLRSCFELQVSSMIGSAAIVAVLAVACGVLGVRRISVLLTS